MNTKSPSLQQPSPLIFLVLTIWHLINSCVFYQMAVNSEEKLSYLVVAGNLFLAFIFFFVPRRGQKISPGLLFAGFFLAHLYPVLFINLRSIWLLEINYGHQEILLIPRILDLIFIIYLLWLTQYFYTKKICRILLLGNIIFTMLFFLIAAISS